MTKFLMVALAATALTGTSAAAKKAQPATTPAQVQRLLACRSIADAAQRVLCFDREAAAIDSAINRKDLMVVDRQTVNATRRSLFGFAVPNFGNLLGNEQDQVKEIQSIVARANYRGASEGWTIVLADGSAWAQTDDSPIALAPRKGDKITVRRGMLGSYVLTVGRQPGVKVRRIA